MNILPIYNPIHPVAVIIKESSIFKYIKHLYGDVLVDSFICGRCDGHNDKIYTDYIGDKQQIELYNITFKHHYGTIKPNSIFYIPYNIKPQVTPLDDNYYVPDIHSDSDDDTEYGVYYGDLYNNKQTYVSEMRSYNQVYSDYIIWLTNV